MGMTPSGLLYYGVHLGDKETLEEKFNPYVEDEGHRLHEDDEDFFLLGHLEETLYKAAGCNTDLPYYEGCYADQAQMWKDFYGPVSLEYAFMEYNYPIFLAARSYCSDWGEVVQPNFEGLEELHVYFNRALDVLGLYRGPIRWYLTSSYG